MWVKSEFPVVDLYIQVKKKFCEVNGKIQKLSIKHRRQDLGCLRNTK